jgi:hypothetical protein
MSLRSVLFSIALISGPAGVPVLAQQVLKDPIPHPIPVSPIQVTLQPVAAGLVSPIDLTVIGGSHDDRDRGGNRGRGHEFDRLRRVDRKFIIDQTGLVLLMKDGVIQPTPFLDITAVIAQLSPAFGSGPKGLNPGYDERGLLGLAFHPHFWDVGRPGFLKLYTLHNVPVATDRAADFPQPPFPAGAVPNCQEVIAEWSVNPFNPDVVNPASYRELLRYDKPEFNHNGGTLAFGRDEFLYAAFGDGGAANDVGNGHIPATGNAQSLGTILGKMIRIDPLHPAHTGHQHGIVSANGQYRIPRSNPFVGQPGALGEIFAYGFRNPYRFSFDAKDDRLILGDVGQNNVEEVDIITRGGNFGWHWKEGTFVFDPSTGNVLSGSSPVPKLIDPVVEYDHFEATANAATRIAVVGGFVYRGSKVPELKGRYICADLNGFLFVADLETGSLELLMQLKGMFIKGFGQDSDRELYVMASGIEGPSGKAAVVLSIGPAPGAGHHNGGHGGRD